MNAIFLSEPDSRYKGTRPQEDYLLRSQKHPIFAVADGVTLQLDERGNYPEHSGAAQAARIFCEAAIEEAERRYEKFSKNDLLEVFRAGNREVLEYNEREGRTRENIDHFRHDFFGATAAFALQKDSRLFWFSLCDSYVAIFGAWGRERFVSPEPPLRRLVARVPQRDRVSRGIEIRKTYRNRGDATGYGVATGEPEAERYLMSGAQELLPGDFFALYTDGFEHYFAAQEFTALFSSRTELMGKVRALGAAMERQDPARFGLERSLIAVFV